MATIDWLIIAGYLAAMLAIGLYYGAQTKSAEDYLLGGRRMGAVSVGLSLFAAILSTISCLAAPGEMIQHGPMVFSDVLVYPLVYAIVGWLLIPVFIRLQVTTAYEVLETRFGLGVRLLGSLLFLTLRLVWMSVIVYATTSKVLIPLSGLPASWTPAACLVIGAVTVAYTSIGGLRAVVVTDVIQESILLGGILLALVLISLDLGGAAAWWPNHWMPHWDKFSLAVSSETRMTVPMAMLTGLLWWICTAGSDQIAIQRYLATRDSATARRALAISLAASFLSALLLGTLGLALLAYFRANPSLLASDMSVQRNGDKLFARFIAIGLPRGVTGLVIAGLLATAMSSLSSGINSACSVVSVDLLDRLRPAPNGSRDAVRRNKAISWALGGLVVVLSTAVGEVEGNLLEVSFKAANLLVAPLFLLVFFALFVPWSTRLGAVTAVAASTVLAVGVAYFEWFGMSFIWIMPMSLAAGLAGGIVVSLGQACLARPAEP
ncbi:MAG: sodium-coupled permease [Planctomycetota bacterium]|nr:MAG: sodium-coupled permease [Planctomycetota bacterium]